MSIDPNSQQCKKAFQVAVQYISSLPDGQWVKAGKLGTIVSSHFDQTGLYNKPSIKILLTKFAGEGTIFERSPELGYRPIRQNGAAGFDTQLKKSDTPPIPLDMDGTSHGALRATDPLPIIPRSTDSCSTLSVVSVFRNLVYLSDGSVSTVLAPSCSHRVLERCPKHLSCVMCGLRFRSSINITTLFSNLAVTDAITSALLEEKK